MTDETTVSQEQKEAAAAALIPFLDKTIEMVLTPTLHIFIQPDGLHIIYYGGQKLGYVLNGELYTLEIYREGTPARDKNAFIQNAIGVVKKAFKIQGKELPEADFYYDYTKYLESYLPTQMESVESLVANMDIENIREAFMNDPLYVEFLELKKKYPDGFSGVLISELKKSVPPVTDPVGDKKIAKAPPVIPDAPNENNLEKELNKIKSRKKPVKKAAKKKAKKK